MASPRLFRVIVPVRSADEAAAFYERLLGIVGVRVAPTRHYFHCGPTILACVDPAGEGMTFRPNPDHIYFAVDDLSAALVRAQQAGCSGFDVRGQDTGIAPRPWGDTSFYAQDPFGNPLCFVQSGTEFTGEREPDRP